jgi:arylsulfatase
MKTKHILTALSLALFAAIASPAGAQDVLPRPEQPFGGKIGRITKDSAKDFPKQVEAPKGAPNILVILTDDVNPLFPFPDRLPRRIFTKRHLV